MKVLKAECAGACYGVKRALELASEAAARTGCAQTLGPIIHNPQVVESLAEQGVSVAEDLSSISCGTVIVRSHGITPELRDELDAMNVEVVDASCPHVLRAQKAAYELAQSGKTVLVVGEDDHPEVKGLAAWAARGGSKAYVANDASSLPADLPEEVGIVVQTTQARDKLDAIVHALEDRGMRVEVRDTICSSTSKRQKAAQELAGQVDAMVVVGGKNSSNTTRLFEICSQFAPVAFHVESSSELDPCDFAACSTVGVTAGASTPDDQIDAVVDCLLSW